MKRVVHWIFEDRTSSTGRLVFWQWPNIPLWVFIVGAVARALVFKTGGLHTAVDVIATIGLVVWAVLEIVQGVNPFRRALGVLVLAPLLVRLVASL